MKRILRCSQFDKICRAIRGLHLPKYGVPYCGAFGFIPPEYVDEMLTAAERFPELHIVSYFDGGNGVNRFDPDARRYELCLGDKDPNIHITPEISLGDYTEEEMADDCEHAKAVREGKYDNDPVVIAGMNWFRSKYLKGA